jgi:hypothetical protein
MLTIFASGDAAAWLAPVFTTRRRCGSATIPAVPPREKKESACHDQPKEVKLTAPPQSW